MSVFKIGDRVQVISPQFALHGFTGTVVAGPNAYDVYEIELDMNQLFPAGWYGGNLICLPESNLALWVTLSMPTLSIDELFSDAPVRETFREPKCECGSDKSNQPGHSSWCPKYRPYN